MESLASVVRLKHLRKMFLALELCAEDELRKWERRRRGLRWAEKCSVQGKLEWMENVLRGHSILLYDC